MKRLLIVLPILLLVVAGGLAGWMFTRSPSEERTVELPPPEPPAFVELTPMVLPMIQDGRVTQHITLKVVVEVDADYADLIEHALPAITDAYFSELHGLLALRYVREHGNMLDLLGRRLLLVSDRVLGRGVIGKVLVSELGRRNPTTS